MSVTSRPKALTKAQARKLTNEVRADAEALWAKCLKLYEGQAHKALGYKSWGDYWEAEFGQISSHAYKLLNAARVSPLITIDGNGDVGPLVADTLAPVLKNEGEQAVKDIYATAVKEHGPKPTARQVRQTVDARNKEPDVWTPEPKLTRKAGPKSGLSEAEESLYQDIGSVQDNLVAINTYLFAHKHEQVAEALGEIAKQVRALSTAAKKLTQANNTKEPTT